MMAVGSGMIEKMLSGETGSSDINFETIAWTLFFSILYSYSIALAYRLTYRGPAYSRNFAQSIILLGVLVSIVIAVVGNSVARAFGVFGALSIIRYRVPMHDPKDLTYVLGSVVIGLACGVGEYIEAGFATLVLISLLTVMHLSSLGLGPPDSMEGKKHKKDDEPTAEVSASGEPLPDHEKKKHKKHHDKDEDDD